ncbi:MAG: hypothetical protein IT379_28910 [Deltaproteobacteria bacterium]|nr:hypothetical protein [Deltaproteobacteria bacterium]
MTARVALVLPCLLGCVAAWESPAQAQSPTPEAPADAGTDTHTAETPSPVIVSTDAQAAYAAPPPSREPTEAVDGPASAEPIEPRWSVESPAPAARSSTRTWYFSEHRRRERTWYGWQNLLVFLGSAATSPFGVGVAGLVLGGPIIHWSHGNVGEGFTALGLNLGLTTLGGAIGYGVICANDGCSGELGGLGAVIGFGLGGAIGLLLANIIDIAALAYEEAEPQTERRAAARPQLVPDLRLSPTGVSAGVGGTF